MQLGAQGFRLGKQVGSGLTGALLTIACAVNLQVPRLGVNHRLPQLIHRVLDEAAGKDQGDHAKGDGEQRHQRAAALAQHIAGGKLQ